MSEKLKRILTEWSEFTIPNLYVRDFNYALLDSDEILSIIGARRSGKTYLCFQMIGELKNSNPRSNILYINFEDERLYPLRGDELTLLWDTFRELFEVDLSRKMYIFIDEIQNAHYWSKWARRMTEQHKNVKLIITGSSSKLLSREIATELRGRTLTFTVYPLSFREYLRAKDIQFDITTVLYGSDAISVKKEFRKYFLYGGFPAIINSSTPYDLLREYFRVMFYRDVIERNSVDHIRLFEDFLKLSIDQIASHYSLSSTAKKLESFGYRLSKNTLSSYLGYAEDVFLLFETKKYSFKVKEQIRDPRKLYVIDHGLAQAVRFAFSDDYGRLMENIVFAHLVRNHDEIYYFKHNRECDFLISEQGRITYAVQVCKDLSDEKTKRREIEGLVEAARLFKLDRVLLITDDEHDTIKTADLTIEVLPIWYWLLLT